MKLYRNWIINEVARAGEHTNERTYVRTYVLTYIRTGQTLYPLHNFVVRGDNHDVQTQIHCYFNVSFFCSVVAGGTSHFYSFFFRKYFGKG